MGECFLGLGKSSGIGELHIGQQKALIFLGNEGCWHIAEKDADPQNDNPRNCQGKF